MITETISPAPEVGSSALVRDFVHYKWQDIDPETIEKLAKGKADRNAIAAGYPCVTWAEWVGCRKSWIAKARGEHKRARLANDKSAAAPAVNATNKSDD